MENKDIDVIIINVKSNLLY